jgi:hypothetical protein
MQGLIVIETIEGLYELQVEESEADVLAGLDEIATLEAEL